MRVSPRGLAPNRQVLVLVELLIVLALVLVNGIFAGAEIAVLSVRKTRLAELVDAGSNRARALSRLREDPESFLATVQVGITVVGSTAAAFGGASVAERLEPLIATVPLLAPFAENLSVGIVVVAVSFLSLVLGELVPKSLALRAGESYALLIAPGLALLATLARPAVALLTGASNLVLRVFGDSTTFTEARLSRDEVQQIVEEAATTGSVDAHAGEIAARAIDFSDLDVHAVMVPRPEIIALRASDGVAEVARAVKASGHTRFPVYDDAVQDYTGFVNVRQYLATAVTDPAVPLSAHLRPLVFLPETMAATAVLRKLQAERATLGMVIDEQGTVVGLVTIEDLLEELVGDILSENETPAQRFQSEGDGVWCVPGNETIHEINRELGLELPEGDYSTVAGLVLSVAGVLPAAGWSGDVADGVQAEVLEVTARRIKRVRLRLVAA